MKGKLSGGNPGEKLSPGRTLGKEKMTPMSKTDRKSPSVKKIDNRFPQSRKGGEI